MADIMDYIDWRGDIGFDEVHVNEVDLSLIHISEPTRPY